MGCSSSKQNAHQFSAVPANQPKLLGNTAPRTRLSVNGKPDSKPGSTAPRTRLSVNGMSASTSETVRSNRQAVPWSADEIRMQKIVLIDLVQSLNPQGKCGCAVLHSVMDPNMKDSYKSKQMASKGRLDSLVGCGCKKGLKPTMPNQDSFCIIQCGNEFDMYILCDGHGTDGHHISDIGVNMLAKFVLTAKDFRVDLASVLVDAFAKVHAYIEKAGSHEGFDVHYSGCAATFVFHDKRSSKLTVAHVGDCRVGVGSTHSDDVDKKAKALTTDHTPELELEKERIESKGGSVRFDGYANYRLYVGNTGAPGMNMSRALGDVAGHEGAGVTAVPTVTEVELDSDVDVLFVCSDGVWEFLEPADLVRACTGGKPQKSSESICKRAWDCWMKEEKGQVVDDITAIVVQLSPQS